MQVINVKAVRFENPESVPGQNVNDYCFLHSSQYAEITGKKKCESADNDPDLYLVVKSSSRKIYLKYHCGHNSSETAAMSYNNLYRLRLLKTNRDDPEQGIVSIAKSHYFMYMWMYGDATQRLTFRLGVVGTVTGVVSIVSDVLTALL